MSFESPTAYSTDDLPQRLVETFRRIQAERMTDLPILNPYIDVEAVGFRRWQGQWVGVLVTPWHIGLYVLPGDEATWPRVARGASYSWALPLGDYDFLMDQEAGFGPYHVCTLMSPVTQFTDQATARASAEALMAQLFANGGAGEAQAAHAAAAQPEEPLTSKGVSRRHFLRGGRD